MGSRVGSAQGVAGVVQRTLSLSGSLSAGITENPIFQFVPLTGTNLSQAVLSPISDKVFYTFYDQNWPADWLARIMVQSVQKQTTNAGVLKNDYWINDPTDPTYPQFLEFCNNLRNAQKKHLLAVDMEEAGTNIVYSSGKAKLADVLNAIAAGMNVTCDTNSDKIYVVNPNQKVTLVETNIPQTGSEPQPIQSEREFLLSASNYVTLQMIDSTNNFVKGLENQNQGHQRRLRKNGDFIKAKDFASYFGSQAYSNKAVQVDEFIKTNRLGIPAQVAPSSIEAGIVSTNEGFCDALKFLKYNTAQYIISRTQQNYGDNLDALANDPAYTAAKYYSQCYRDVLDYDSALDLAKSIGAINIKTRTFEAILFCVANEERLFNYETNRHNLNNIEFTPTPYGTIATVTPADSKPYIVRPILMIQYPKRERNNLTPLTEVIHDDTRYTIGDLEGENENKDPELRLLYEGQPSPYQNRTVFSIISYLFLQTSTGTQNLPVQQLIQVQ